MDGRKQQQQAHKCYHAYARSMLLNREQSTRTEESRPPLCSHQQERRRQQQEQRRQKQEQQRLLRQKVASKQQPEPRSSDRPADKSKIVQVSDDRFLMARLKADGYELGFTVGKGSYSKVRAAVKLASNAEHATVTQRFACKVIDKLRKGVDGDVPSEYVRKFLPRELDVLGTIRHPHVVSTHKIYVAPSTVLVFMDFCEMGDLLSLMENVGVLPSWQVHLFFKQICEAVDYLHQKGIVHRDIKCENILLENLQYVKLTDFGFARICAEERGRRVISQTYCGSSKYAAPEILQGIPYDPKASDVWAMGVVLYAMLANCMPYPQNHPRQIVANQKAKNLNKPNNPINSEAQSLVSIILEPDVARRATVKQIRRHPWVMQSTPYRPTQNYKILKK